MSEETKPTPATSEGQTPRTKAQCKTIYGDSSQFVVADFARTLERELTAMSRRAEEAERERDRMTKLFNEARDVNKNLGDQIERIADRFQFEGTATDIADQVCKLMPL